MSSTTQELVAHAKSHITEWDAETAVHKLEERRDIVLLDVREPAEFNEACIGNACNIPRGVLEFKVDPTYAACEKALLDRGLEILVYCKTGGRSVLAAYTLLQLGYTKVVSLAGGIESWVSLGYNIAVPQKS